MAFLTKLALAIVVLSLAVYIFGLPPQLKRKLQQQALQTVGQNQAGHILKESIDKIPSSDDRDLRELQRGASEGVAGLARGGVGRAVGDAVDGLASGFESGR